MFLKTKNLNSRLGFTLIELLVVISIIGILSSFSVVALNSARMKARDALRKGDMAQLRTALSLYYDDNYQYPICGTWVDDELQAFGANDIANGDNPDGACWCYINAVEAELSAGTRPIMPEPPRDPKNSSNSCLADGTYNYRYVSTPNGDSYAIVYTLEDGGEKIMRGW